ncbi:metalloregulator ArsR/SmtB family transcription factor [Colwellia sp. MB02u-18]|uniref:metalloregulator ArsR/SmtB family transcription factor n=1 Tax=unclassified Colwellia TaxID=196834 RepID=UPI0015F4FE09|nr:MULTISPECIES: metalloregulator ArsR/SmtB family transcription factor [unclassified Colwellia]MBA6224212.1 metalloregulator ArsR/SmtB family transcription factor [Colwellia sp. MB3u-45]MBA6268342.1 metalloregulator ArsR/SmtB family transcription factor [Colwellia sp. MB3u-43]MBA6294704.1 metalloregulator ArsR/SmtB family transcription factor [Colwellia sp. MB02u-9]MBA6322706.1 metalloregulator ArsR/SmtB family transcription factor [Colwellia sp. MB02u-19]MBA6323544.1 metalloregulator ArsR/Sm
MNPTEFYKNLADDIRLKSILLIAQEGELCVCELMAALAESSQPKISRHLAVLKSSGLLLTRKQKQWVFYSINPDVATWAQQVISLTLKENINFITPHLQALHLMGARPERIANCCE